MNEVTRTNPEPADTMVCSSCGAEGQVAGQPCTQCQRLVVNVPRWAQPVRGRRWLNRRRIVRTTIAVVVLAFLAWLYYPFFPNPITLWFRAPSTEASSESLAGQWAMEGRDLQLTRSVPAGAQPPQGSVAWTRNLGTYTRAAPVVQDGVMYVGAFFEIIALDAATGDELWTVNVPSPLNHSVAVAGDLIYVGLLDHRFLAVDKNTQEVRWRFKAGGPITSSPAVSGGIVYLGSGDSSMHALDAATGSPIWQAEIKGELRSAPAVYDGLLYAADHLGNMYIFDARTGQGKLRFRTEGTSRASPTIANGLVYFPAGGRLYSVDAKAREIPGEYQFKRVWSQFWVWRIPGVPPPPVQKGGQWRFDPEKQEDSSGLVATPAATPESLYLGNFHGNFYSIDAVTGKQRWQFQSDGEIFGSAVLVGDRVHFGTHNGTFYALNAADGQPAWQIDLGAPADVSPVYADGRLYVRTTDGNLHAIE